MTFEQAMRLAGLRPGVIVADGRWRRCSTESKPRKRNGAYVLSIDGARGWFRDWADPTGVQMWQADGPVAQRPADLERIERQREAERRRRIEAIAGARRYWQSARPFRGHPYIAGKGLTAQGCAGVRLVDELLVIPVLWGQSVISVQTIDAKGAKRFWPGAPVKGACYVIDRPRASVTAICEGFATGLAIYQTCANVRVIVAFDAGNLAAVVQRIKPVGQVVIAADNDIHTERRIGVNPGLEAAHRAAALIGCGVAWPQGIDGTDWCDALTTWGGPVASRKIERLILAQARYVTGENNMT